MSMLLVTVFANSFHIGPIVMISKANPGDVSDSYDNTTTLNVTVLQLQPRVNWYDFQFNNSGTWVSRLNQQIDVNNSAEYRFVVNISSDEGWDNITFINITAWHDNGSEATIYNQTGAADNRGGNRNLFLQYENTSATAETATWRLIWPDDEVYLVGADSFETVVNDPSGSPGNTECHNITFAFVPGYQFRYAPDPTDAAAGHNDTWSWNFNITATNNDSLFSYDNPTVGESINEFGVYSYTEIVSTGWPTITGYPGDTPAYNDSYISMVTRSNGNYSLSVDVDNLSHKTAAGNWIDNTSIYTAGGELSPLTAFGGAAPQWYYGGVGVYTAALKDDTSLTTSDLEWAVDIILGTYPGDYNATIYYHFMTEI